MEFVITLLGEDRPGLVARLSETVKTHGGNWLESRMSQLSGQFAGLLLVSAPEEQAEALKEALERLAGEGLSVQMQRGKSAEVDSAQVIRIELVGHDRPGIIREITQVLARHGGNVEELDTGIRAAPMSGELLFEATILLTLPAGIETSDLRQDLEAMANNLMVDLSLEKRL